MSAAPQITSSAVSDAAGKLWTAHATSAAAITGLTARLPGAVISGPAHTLRISPVSAPDPEARSTFLGRYQSVPAGSVLVIETVGDVGGAILGDVVAHLLAAHGVAGVLTDGDIRDVAPIRELGFPVWSGGLTPRAIRTGEVVTEIDVPVRCGGVVVQPGDVVVADEDGAFVVPPAKAEAVLELAAQIVADEQRAHEAIAAGGDLVGSYTPIPQPAAR